MSCPYWLNMCIEIEYSIRPADPSDGSDLSDLVRNSLFVHKHLDWRTPGEWLGYQPYLVAENHHRLLGALACPIISLEIAWIRLFTSVDGFILRNVWERLWLSVHAQLMGVDAKRPGHSEDLSVQSIYPIQSVAAIPLDHWFEGLLKASHFQKTTEVVSLLWGGQVTGNHNNNPNIIIRPMVYADLVNVARVDKMAFQLLWQQTEEDLDKAFRQAFTATVIEVDEEVVGYQISTPTQMGGHIARLAVLPGEQKKGYGYELLSEALNLFLKRGIRNVTVNTQKDNLSSLSLYKKAGFHLTGESFPVYEYFI